MKIVEWINLADMCRIGTLKFSHQNYAIILIFVFFQGSQEAEPKALKKSTENFNLPIVHTSQHNLWGKLQPFDYL